MPANDPIDPSGNGSCCDLAAQAGLVLRNERPHRSCEAGWPTCKRRRSVSSTAQDHERRKLERNIHDGAQQQLVALAGPPAARRAARRSRPGEGEGDARRAAGGHGNGARRSARPRPGHLPAVARRPGPGRGAPGPGTALDGAGRYRGANDVGRLPAEIEAAVYFSRARGAAERGEVRGGHVGPGHPARGRRRDPVRRARRRAWLRPPDRPAAARACKASPTGSGRSTGRSRSTVLPAAGQPCAAGCRRASRGAARRLARSPMSTREATAARGDRRLRMFGVALFVAMVLGVALRAFLNAANGGARSDLETGTRVRRDPVRLPGGRAGARHEAAAQRAGVADDGDRPGVHLDPRGSVRALCLHDTCGRAARRRTRPRDPGAVVGRVRRLWSGFLLLLFPDGHLPSRRWRWFARLSGVGLAVLFVVTLLSPDHGADYGLPGVENPLAIEAIASALNALTPLALIAPLSVIGGAVAVIGRLRRTTDPVQRSQLRWLAWGAGVMAFAYAMAFVAPGGARVGSGGDGGHPRHARGLDVPARSPSRSASRSCATASTTSTS